MKKLIILIIATILPPFISLQADDSTDFKKFKEAIIAQDVNKLRELLSRPSVNSNALGKDYIGRPTTPFGYFLSLPADNLEYQTYMQFLNAFLDSRSVDLNVEVQKGESLLHTYIRRISTLVWGDLVIKKILDHPDMKVANLQSPVLKQTFLHDFLYVLNFSPHSVKTEFINAIVSHRNFDPYIRNHLGDLPVHTAARYLSDVEVIRFLIHYYKSSLDSVTDLGKTVSVLLSENTNLTYEDTQQLRREVSDLLNERSRSESVKGKLKRCFGG